MTLLEELKNRHAELSQQLDEAREREEALHEEILDLEKAIGGIDPSFWDDDGEYDYADDDEIEAAPEPATADLFEDKPQEIEASSQSELFVSLPAATDLPTLPGGAEESRDHSDDVSEFGDPDEPAEHISILTGDPAIEPESGLHGEGYAPVVDPEPSPLIDAQTCEPVNPHVEPETLADPIWNEPAPTKPEADAIAKAVDYYDPKAVAERNRFDPFRMFRRETEDA